MRLLLLGLILVVIPSIASAQTAVYLVRHAEKVDQSPDAKLSEAGHARARRIARMLRDVKVTHVYTSEVERTQQTAAPLVEQSKATRIVVKAKGSTEEIPKQLKQLKPSDIAVVVSHSNIVPALWKALGCTPDITLEDDEFDRFLVVIPQKSGPPVCQALRME